MHPDGYVRPDLTLDMFQLVVAHWREMGCRPWLELLLLLTREMKSPKDVVVSKITQGEQDSPSTQAMMEPLFLCRWVRCRPSRLPAMT